MANFTSLDNIDLDCEFASIRTIFGSDFGSSLSMSFACRNLTIPPFHELMMWVSGIGVNSGFSRVTSTGKLETSNDIRFEEPTQVLSDGRDLSGSDL